MRTEIETPRLVIDLLILPNLFYGKEEKRGEIIPHPRYLEVPAPRCFLGGGGFFWYSTERRRYKITKRVFQSQCIPNYCMPRISP